jgi:predicted MPP superfamily phosphohydrolase
MESVKMTVILIILTIPLRSLAWWIWADRRLCELGLPLTLAGHTHGGQLMLTPELGAGSAMFRYWSGIYQKNSRTVVVSNGTGNWFPVRVNAPAEIIHLTLRRA